MEFDVEVEVNETRLVIRNLLLKSVVQEFHETHNISLRDIASELLVVASMIVSDDDCEINNSINYSLNFGSSDEDSEDDEEDVSYEIEDARRELKNLKKEVKKFSKDIEKRKVNKWDIYGIPERIEECVDDMEDEVFEIFKDEILKLKESVTPLVKKAEIIWDEIQLEETADRLIYNVGSIKSILSDLKEVESGLRNNGVLTSEREELIKKTKEKCAIYRASKKMLDFEIAENSGSTAKAHKLKAEAKALLMQDWESIMKDNDYPDVAYLKS